MSTYEAPVVTEDAILAQVTGGAGPSGDPVPG